MSREDFGRYWTTVHAENRARLVWGPGVQAAPPMRRLRLREALAFDGDFAAAGFVEMRPTA